MPSRTARPTPSRRWRLVWPGLLAAAAVFFLLRSGGDPDPPRREPTPDPRPFVAGSGARAALVLPARGDARRPAVVFLHGWGLTGRRAYRPWLRHLAARGSTVIAPRYQDSLQTPSSEVPDNALAGVRAAVGRLRPAPRRVVVVGHSAGGVLALDYAVRAPGLGLPPAVAVMVVYPGGAMRTMPPVPEDDPAALPPTVERLLVLASPSDTVVGTGPAEAIEQGATSLPPERRELISVTDPAAADHFAPVTDTPAARRVFWQALDELLAAAG